MPWAYVELHPKIHSVSPEYGDTTCLELFVSLAEYKKKEINRA